MCVTFKQYKYNYRHQGYKTAVCQLLLVCLECGIVKTIGGTHKKWSNPKSQTLKRPAFDGYVPIKDLDFCCVVSMGLFKYKKLDYKVVHRVRPIQNNVICEPSPRGIVFFSGKNRQQIR